MKLFGLDLWPRHVAVVDATVDPVAVMESEATEVALKERVRLAALKAKEVVKEFTGDLKPIHHRFMRWQPYPINGSREDTAKCDCVAAKMLGCAEFAGVSVDIRRGDPFTKVLPKEQLSFTFEGLNVHVKLGRCDRCAKVFYEVQI